MNEDKFIIVLDFNNLNIYDLLAINLNKLYLLFELHEFQSMIVR